MNRILMTVFLVLVSVSGVLAQLPTATILGQVKDASGAVVAGAKVTARNKDTNQARAAVTSDDGSFRFDALPVGNYEITVEKTGFKTEVQSGLTLTVAQEAVANFTVQVGEMAQTVAVTAEAPLVSTTTSSLGGLVDDQRIADLPLNGRNYIDLTLLQPGVTQDLDTPGTALGVIGTMYSANGAPMRSNAYLLDGALLQNLFGTNGASAIGTTLGVDGILEYRVITNNFSAEYGGSMGSIQAIVSKGGTNQLHGDIFEFLRNSDLDARNYFDLPPGTIGHRLPEFQRNNFGGALGGPIKKDKTFFFGVYEGLSQSLGTTNTASVLGTGCHGLGGAVITLAACPQISPSTSVTIAPQMAPLLALYPLPNLPGNTYGFGFTQPTAEHYGQVRVDQTISSSDNFFGRYTIDQVAQTGVFQLPQFKSDLASRNQFLTLSENHIFSTSLLNSARFSFSRTNLQLLNEPSVTGPQYGFAAGQQMGNLTINGLTGEGNSGSAPERLAQNIFTWSDDVDYTRGRHSLKIGVVFNHYQSNLLLMGELRGTPVFGGVAQFLTAQLLQYTVDPPGSILQRHYHFDVMGFYLQDDWRVTPRLMLNLGMRYEPTTTYEEVHGISASLRNVATDATTTLGPPFRNPSLRNFSPRFGFAWDVTGNGRTAIRGGFAVLYDLVTLGSALSNATMFTPPFAETTEVTSGTFTIPFVFPANAGATVVYRGPDYYIQQPHMLTYNLTVERQLPGSMALTLSYVGSRGINLLQDREVNPTLPNGIPSNGRCVQPPAGTLINTADQIDGQATSCFLTTATRRNLNWGPLQNSVAGGDSIYSALEVLLNKRLSRGLQVQSSYTWSRLIDDTQSGTVSDDTGATTFEGADTLHERTDRGPANFDLTNNWRVNAIYHLPAFTSSKGFLGKLENGWWTSGIYSLLSGYPMGVFLGSSRSEDFETNSANALERPDNVSGRINSNITHGVSVGCGTGATRAAEGTSIAAGTPLGTPALWYDPCAYYIQPQGFLGDEGRNFLRGPGYNFLNFSVVKDTAVGFLGEGGEVEFRAEFFNLLNHPNFALPTKAAVTAYSGTCPGTGAVTLGSCGPTTTNPVNPTAAAGTLTATNGTSRQIQFGLKILF